MLSNTIFYGQLKAIKTKYWLKKYVFMLSVDQAFCESKYL